MADSDWSMTITEGTPPMAAPAPAPKTEGKPADATPPADQLTAAFSLPTTDGGLDRAAAEVQLEIDRIAAEAAKMQGADGAGEPDDVNALALAVRKSLSAEKASAALDAAQAAFDVAQLERPVGDPELASLRVELEGARFDAGYAEMTVPYLEKTAEDLQRMVFDLEIEAERQSLELKKFDRSETPRLWEAEWLKGQGIQEKVAALDQVSKLREASLLWDAKAEQAARTEITERYRRADEARIAQLQTDKAEPWEIESAQLDARRPLEARSSFKKDFAEALEVQKNLNYTAQRDQYIREVLKAERVQQYGLVQEKPKTPTALRKDARDNARGRKRVKK
jgi:hypothetical protein